MMQNRCVNGGSYPVCKSQQRVRWRRHHDVNHAMTSRKYIFPHRLFRYQHFLSRFSRWWIRILLIWLLFLGNEETKNKVRSIQWNKNFQNRSRNKETEKNNRLDAILDWLYYTVKWFYMVLGKTKQLLGLGDKRTLFGLFRHVYGGFTVGNGVFLATR